MLKKTNLKLSVFIDKDHTDILYKAFIYFKFHLDYVFNLLKDTTTSFAPSAEDLNKPELWKAKHWRWFYDNYMI